MSNRNEIVRKMQGKSALEEKKKKQKEESKARDTARNRIVLAMQGKGLSEQSNRKPVSTSVPEVGPDLRSTPRADIDYDMGTTKPVRPRRKATRRQDKIRYSRSKMRSR